MKIQVRVKHVEILLEEETDPKSQYPRIVTPDKWKDNKTKSERLIEVVKELTSQAIEAYNQTKII